VKEARVKVVMADLALTQLANRSVEALTTPEYRRLTIGVQLVRDPGEIFINPSPLSSCLPNSLFYIYLLNQNYAQFRKIDYF
jgi:ATP-binding cassette subfamily G (WHITE) protein 5 (sterolin 1)